ncbi:MAG: ABC transporter ATP-binding protein [Flavobacteriales bacterium]|jgi:peptide/nickel transport system ATP-binding protein|nr:ABC transporter ATP-binding protein [Flavobacteriales bacterium]
MLQVKNLNISFLGESGQNEVVHNISFNLNESEILGIVGESGSGKSVTSLALMGLLPTKMSKVTGEICFNDIDLTKISDKAFQKIRGAQIAMIFQDPMSALNPSLTCGFQVQEMLLQHNKITKKQAKIQVIALFKKVKLPRPESIFNQYPHQISGGQKQRVVIAMAIACKPQILIADEPTTALDVTVQKEIILLLKALQQETNMSLLFISHDLTLVSEIADRVVVMQNGNIVEQGTTETIFKNPKHSYTKALLNARPSLDKRLEKLPTVGDFLNDAVQSNEVTTQQRVKIHKEIYSKPPLLEIVDVATYFNTSSSWFAKENKVVKAVDHVSFKVYEKETVGLVGESGCGKTTLGRSILLLEKPNSGQIKYKGVDILQLAPQAVKDLRKDIQIIFQDPYSSLNPRIQIGQALMEPMKVHGLYKNDAERQVKVFELLEKVGLEAEHFYRYPHEFSGGQRQRIGIARTIALQPKIIICDESVSALDVSVQAQVLNLLNSLKADFNFTYIFISHDLAVVKYMADQLIVMKDGKIDEQGDADAVYKNPKSNYTKQLLRAIPKGI